MDLRCRLPLAAACFGVSLSTALAQRPPVPEQPTGLAPLLHNVYSRPGMSLDGAWHYIVDPFETGYRNHRHWEPFDAVVNTKASARSYYGDERPAERWERIEYDFRASPTLAVPGDWNHQDARLEYYEGSLWYQREFSLQEKPADDERVYLYFGAANYRADVYLNGEKVGYHEGGFHPFNFDVTDRLRAGDNVVTVRVDNRREADRVPGRTFDWWNYGGLTRSVRLVTVPATHVRDYTLQLNPAGDSLVGYVETMGPEATEEVTLAIEELGLRERLSPKQVSDSTARARIGLSAPAGLRRWDTDNPYRYAVNWRTEDDELRDRIGFRTIEQRGEDVLLNGRSVFMRGICVHAEIPGERRRAHSRADAEQLLGWAGELNANMARLAHYPHPEHMPRVADSLGILLWEEVPVYWGIDYRDAGSLRQAVGQVRSLVHRDKNRASVVIWSVANETPREDPDRLAFLERLAAEVRAIDSSRLVSAALDRTEDEAAREIAVTDPFAATTDVVSVNEYIGWYGSTPERIAEMRWDLAGHDKPLFISEFGAGALAGLRGDSLTRWSEEYQAWMYRETLAMLDAIPSLRGMTPWLLADFRSPRRNLAGVQDGWNRKGLIGDGGQRKLAWEVLRAYYGRKAAEWGE